MEWMNTLLSAETLKYLIPIVAIIAGCSVVGAKAYFTHVERMEKIRQGMNPDTHDAD
ncbi:MAG: hypothetical protein IIC60_11870 [Proteobacteria bacterium]|nr:hypothetical protein [Pseudomonadota bacterium]